MLIQSQLCYHSSFYSYLLRYCLFLLFSLSHKNTSDQQSKTKNHKENRKKWLLHRILNNIVYSHYNHYSQHILIHHQETCEYVKTLCLCVIRDDIENRIHKIHNCQYHMLNCCQWFRLIVNAYNVLWQNGIFINYKK